MIWRSRMGVWQRPLSASNGSLWENYGGWRNGIGNMNGCMYGSIWWIKLCFMVPVFIVLIGCNGLSYQLYGEGMGRGWQNGVRDGHIMEMVDRLFPGVALEWNNVCVCVFLCMCVVCGVFFVSLCFLACFCKPCCVCRMGEPPVWCSVWLWLLVSWQ